MSSLTTYTIADIRHELSQLRAAVNYAEAMLEGIEASVPGATVQVGQTPNPAWGGWPPCENPPCIVAATGLSDTGDVIRIRGRNVDNLLLALQNGQHGADVESAEFSPRSFPLEIPKAGLPEVDDQPDPDAKK